MTRFALTAIVALWLSSLSPASTLVVSPSGGDAAAGTRQDPASLSGALRRASQDPAIDRIELLEGDYPHSVEIPPLTPERVPTPPLTVAAAAGATPRLHQMIRVTDAQPWGESGRVYRVKFDQPGAGHLWEQDTRTRLAVLATRQSVAVYRASSFLDTREGWLYLHTSDGGHPREHELFMDRSRVPTLTVRRPGVVIEGLHFLGNHAGPAIDVRAEHVTLRDCRVTGGRLGIQVFTGADHSLVEQCTVSDAAQGLITFAQDTTVRDSRFLKQRDGLMLDVYPQDDCAVQIYSPGRMLTVAGCLARGFRSGVFIKADGGPYRVRHNTLVALHTGIHLVTGNRDSDVSFNLICDAMNFIEATRLDDTLHCDDNLYWSPRDPVALWRQMQRFASLGRDRRSLIADPRFVNAAQDDYRLAGPTAAPRSEQGRLAGAFDEAPESSDRLTRPSLALEFHEDSIPGGVRGQLLFERDPWIGGGVSVVRDLLPEPAVVTRIAQNTSIDLTARGQHPSLPMTRLRYRVSEQDGVEMAYQERVTVALPDDAGGLTLMVQVGTPHAWSEPATARIEVDRSPPTLLDAPRIAASRHGLLLTFRSSEPCTAVVRYGTSAQSLEQQAVMPDRLSRNWNANDGGDWVQRWQTPRQDFAVALVPGTAASGATVFFRVNLTDASGQQSQSPLQSAVMQGDPRTLQVTTTGSDEADGSIERPLASLQRAVDLALPGDRIVLGPGCYGGTTLIQRGGLDEQTRLVIEAAPNTVWLEAARRHDSVIHLENAPYVTLRGLGILGFKRAGVLVYRSPHAVIEQCQSWTGEGWVDGYHIFAFYSPHVTVTRCLAIGAESGLYFQESPFATVTHNTISQAMYAAAGYTFSSRGLVQMHNSFAFGGNAIVSFLDRDPEDLKTVRSDYNNFGCDVLGYEPNQDLRQSDPARWERMQAQAFKASYPRLRTISKLVIDAGLGSFHTLTDWQQASGQDRHSIFADPEYVDPLPPVESWNWQVRPGSANVRPDVPGGFIGALGPTAN